MRQPEMPEMRDRECQLMTVGGDDATCRRIDAGIVDQDVDRIVAFAHPHCEGRDAGRISENERLGMQARRAAAVLLPLLDDALRPGTHELGKRVVGTKATQWRDASPVRARVLWGKRE